jgi:hypothetical protein
MKTVILDTNFLVDCLQWRVDFFTELRRVCDFQYKIAVVDKAVDELETIIREGRQVEKTAARLAKQLIAKKRIEIIPTSKKGYTDTLILNAAGKGAVVATQDQDFKRRLRAKGIPVIVIRQKKYLAVAP